MRLYNKIFLIVSMIGLLDSLYLVLIKLSNNANLCIKGIGDCWTVNTSIYAQIFGIPVSFIGTAAYASLLAILILERKPGFIQENSNLILFGLTLVGVLYSVYLTYLEIAVIQAICPFCVISAIAMLVLFAISIFRLVNNQGEATQ
jgi:uncharacterized membrane protein